MMKNSLFAQNEPHTAKLSFSIVLNHFCGNLLKTSFFAQNEQLRVKLSFSGVLIIFSDID